MIKQQRGRLKFESGSSRQSSKNTFVRRQATDRGGGVGGDPSTTSEHHPYSLFKSRSENRLLKDPSLQPDLYQYWIKAQAHFREYRVLRHLLAGSRPGQQERMCNVVSMWMCQPCTVSSVGTVCTVSLPSTAGCGVKVWQLNNMSCTAGIHIWSRVFVLYVDCLHEVTEVRTNCVCWSSQWSRSSHCFAQAHNHRVKAACLSLLCFAAASLVMCWIQTVAGG